MRLALASVTALTLLLLLVVCSVPASAQVAPPELTATAAVLYEPVTGQFLYTKEPDLKIKGASLVKIMTMYVAYEAIAGGEIGSDDPVTISTKAWQLGGSTMFLDEREVVSVEELLMGIAVVSGNDACVALAEHIAGSEQAFVDRMNAVAKRLGLTSTQYANSHGLDDPEHFTTARDVALVSAALIRDHPRGLDKLSEKEFTHAGITQYNRNRLLWTDERVDGLKTGYTLNAGYSLAASARTQDLRLVVVVLGTESEDIREAEAASLLQWGFSGFVTVDAVRQGRPAGSVRVWQGTDSEVDAVFLDTVPVTVPIPDRGAITIEFTPFSELRAPVFRGDKIGDVSIVLGTREIGRSAAVAATDVPQGSWWRRLIDAIRLFFNRAS